MRSDSQIGLAGGVKSPSRAPYHVPAMRFGARMGDSQMVVSMTGMLTIGAYLAAHHQLGGSYAWTIVRCEDH